VSSRCCRSPVLVVLVAWLSVAVVDASAAVSTGGAVAAPAGAAAPLVKVPVVAVPVVKIPAVAAVKVAPAKRAAARAKKAAPHSRTAWGLGDRLPLVVGAKGHDVRVLQDFLGRAGQSTPVDGVFGRSTRNAVVAFERVQRLTADGVVTAQDVTVLRSVVTQGSAIASVSNLTGGAMMPTEQQIAALAPGLKAAVGAGGLAVAPAGAPAVVQAIIAAGNRIATLPYIYGGGHGAGWNDAGYDCSGSVSFALHGGGLLSGPLVSGDFESWGAAGPGQWITIYANGGHVYMVIAGLRFDTSGQRGAGTRWQANMVSGAGFVVRHPVGL
jgi:peptidoglycan hydrolase-like protein with peptidoglycan-binding domain